MGSVDDVGAALGLEFGSADGPVLVDGTLDGSADGRWEGREESDGCDDVDGTLDG